MSTEVEQLLEPEILESLKELSLNEVVVQQLLKKTDNPRMFLNACAAALIVVCDRELTALQLLSAKINEIMSKVKHDNPSLLEPPALG